MVQYLHFRVLEFPLNRTVCRRLTDFSCFGHDLPPLFLWIHDFSTKKTPRGAKDRHSTQEENIQFDTEVVQYELINHFWQKCSIALSKKQDGSHEPECNHVLGLRVQTSAIGKRSFVCMHRAVHKETTNQHNNITTSTTKSQPAQQYHQRNEIATKSPAQRNHQRNNNTSTTKSPAQQQHQHNEITSATTTPAQQHHQHNEITTTCHTPHFTHCTLHTPHFALHTLHFPLHTLHTTLYTPHSTLYTLHFTLYT